MATCDFDDCSSKATLVSRLSPMDILSRAERRHILSERHTNDSTIAGTAMIIS